MTTTAIPDPILVEFTRYLTRSRRSPATISARTELLARLSVFLGHPLLEATVDELVAYQHTYSHLSRATDDIYTRHIKVFYLWALEYDYLTVDPTRRMITIKPRKGVPHPTKQTDLAVIFACARGYLRTAYTLAAFAGLRSAEICRLTWEDIELDVPTPTAVVTGKGERERVIPLLRPVVDELLTAPVRRSWVITTDHGRPLTPDLLSAYSSKYLHGLGIPTTLHSMRHSFATYAVRMTRDPLFVRDLLGHSSVSTTEIYMQSSLEGAHARLSELSTVASALMLNQVTR